MKFFKFIIIVITTSLLAMACASDGPLEGPVNTPPVAYDQELTTKINENLLITLKIEDPNNDMVTFYIHERPTHGKLIQTKINQYRYVPDSGFEGNDYFTYVAFDGKSDSNTGTISIYVGLPNEDPIARDMKISIMENETVDIFLLATDPDSPDSNLVYTIIDAPAQGVLTQTELNKKFTYTPGKDYFGSDSFSFFVNDGLADSNTATVEITIVKRNERPVAISKTITTDEDTAIENIELSGSDFEKEPLTFRLDQGPSNGTLTLTESGYTYVPGKNFNGQDQFTFYANDGILDSKEPGTVTIIVNAVNDAPMVSAKDIIMDKNSDDPLIFNFNAVDADNDTLKYIIDLPEEFNAGTVTQPKGKYDPECAFLPAQGFLGKLEFTFYVIDSEGSKSNEAKIYIYVKLPGVFFVDSNASGESDGMTWKTAFKHPQDAVDAAMEGDKIWIARGRYTKKDGDSVVLKMKPGVSLFGGFKGDEYTFPENRDFVNDETILEGDHGFFEFKKDALHIIIARDLNNSELKAELNGFTIHGGQATNTNDKLDIDLVPGDMGGGIYISNSSPVITNCLFDDNQAVYGGGIYIDKKSNPVITDCDFIDNKASKIGFDKDEEDSEDDEALVEDKGDGGAIFINVDTNVVINKSLFDSNRAYAKGGAICNFGNLNMVVTDLTSNKADFGGGLYDHIGTTKITSCNFGLKDDKNSGNIASNRGGALYNYGVIDVKETDFYYNEAEVGGAVANSAVGLTTGFDVVFSECDFVENKAWDRAGAVYNYVISPEFLGCLFIKNYSKKYGGAIVNSNYSSPLIKSSIFEKNNCSKFGSQGGTIVNYYKSNSIIDLCIFKNNYAAKSGVIYNIKSDPTIINSQIFDNKAAQASVIFNAYESNLKIINCKIFSNESTSDKIIYNNNHSSLNIINTLINSNLAARDGVIFNENFSYLKLTNSTLTGNRYKKTQGEDTVEAIGGGSIKNFDYSNAKILNSILWDNNDKSNPKDKEIYIDKDSDVDIKFTCIDDSLYGNQESNIHEHPKFIVYPDVGKYFLDKNNSPCVDSGDPNTEVNILQILLNKISALFIENTNENGVQTSNYLTVPDITYEENEYKGVIDMGYHYPSDIDIPAAP